MTISDDFERANAPLADDADWEHVSYLPGNVIISNGQVTSDVADRAAAKWVGAGTWGQAFHRVEMEIGADHPLSARVHAGPAIIGSNGIILVGFHPDWEMLDADVYEAASGSTVGGDSSDIGACTFAVGDKIVVEYWYDGVSTHFNAFHNDLSLPEGSYVSSDFRGAPGVVVDGNSYYDNIAGYAPSSSPALTNLAATNIGTETVDIVADTDVGRGTLHVVLADASDGEPNPLRIKRDFLVNGFVAGKHVGVSATGTQTVSFAGLSPGETYYAYVVQQDDVNGDYGLTDVKSVGSFTMDVPAVPTLSNPTALNQGTQSAEASVDTDSPSGTLYFVVTESDVAPTAAQIKGGQDDSGATAAYADSYALDSIGTKLFTASGLALGTTYTFHAVQDDAEGDLSNIVSSGSLTTDSINDVSESIGDGFNRADAPLSNSADWEVPFGSSPAIASGQVVAGGSGAHVARWIGAGDWTTDRQWARAVIGRDAEGTTSVYSGLTVFTDANGCYRLSLAYDSDEFRIYRYEDGGATSVLLTSTGWSTDPASGDELEFEVELNDSGEPVLRVSLNDTEVLTTTDTDTNARTSGNPGIYLDGADFTLDNFEAVSHVELLGVLVPVADTGGNPVANESNVQWWARPDRHSAPEDSGAASTNSNGNLIVDLPNTSKSAGDTVIVEAKLSDGRYGVYEATVE